MTPCIIHQDSFFVDRSGKPRARIGGRHAARVLYERQIGSIAPGLSVCHKCDNGMCINLDHVFLGTQAENMQDAVRKGLPVGRIPKPHPQEEQMVQLKLKGYTNYAIAKALGVDHSTVKHHLRKRGY